jgi:predicted DNA-binding protein YlxM (UPF0122 family)
MSKLVKPIEYAKSQGISRQAVYAKIKKGTLSSKTIDGKIYIILENELPTTLPEESLNKEKKDEPSSPIINFKELLSSKEETISVLKESISDLKQTNTEINTTLRGEIELLKQVFTEMRNLYVKQVDYMCTEKRLELDSVAIEEVMEEIEDVCWITLEEFFERSEIKKEKKKLKIEKRLLKAYKNQDSRLKKEKKILYLSCHDLYEDILRKQ